jgi:hypothetical protein
LIFFSKTIPDPSGQNGSISLFETNATFDFVTGMALTTTDANGQVTTMQYNEPVKYFEVV